MTLEFKTIKKKDAPTGSVRGGIREYKELLEALDKMPSDEVLITEFDDANHYKKVQGIVRNYFGAGVFSFRRISKSKMEVLIKHMTTEDK